MPRFPLLGWCICSSNLPTLSSLPALGCPFLEKSLLANRSCLPKGSLPQGLPTVNEWLIQGCKSLSSCQRQRQFCDAIYVPESSVGPAKARLYLGPHPHLTLSPLTVFLKLEYKPSLGFMSGPVDKQQEVSSCSVCFMQSFEKNLYVQ